MNIFLSFIIFSLFTVFFILCLGHALIRILGITDDLDSLERTAIAGCLGIVVTTLFAFIIRLAGLSFWWMLIIYTLSLWFVRNKLKKILINIKNNKKILKIGKIRYPLAVIIICSVLQVVVLIRGGIAVTDGFAFPSVHDTMWNIAIAQELYHHFPPQHPGLWGERLYNNHYFYPLYLAVNRFFTGIDPLKIYFQFLPLFISFLFGTSLYAASGIFLRNKSWRAITVFLGYFSGNASFLLPFFLGSNFDWRGNSFFSDQPFDQIINPYSVLGFTLLLVGIFCLYKWNQKQVFGWTITVTLLFGVLYGFKAFGGIIAFVALIVTCLWIIFRKHSLAGAVMLLLTFSIFMPVFFFTTKPHVATLRLAPGWLLTELMAQDKLNQPGLVQIESYYNTVGNTLGVIKIKVIQFAIYLTGNLGIRLLGLIYLLLLWFRSFLHRDKDDIVVTFILASIAVSLIVPLLTNLSTTPYNIIQFTPYALVILAVASGAVLERMYQWSVKFGEKNIGLLMIFAVILFAIPVNIKNVISKFEIPEDIISFEEMEILRILKANSTPNDMLVIDPTHFTLNAIYISAISERRIYLANPGYARQTGDDPTYRTKVIENLFVNGDTKRLSQDIPANFLLAKKTKLLEKLELNLIKEGFERFYENTNEVLFKRIANKI